MKNLQDMTLSELEDEYRKQNLIYKREYQAARSFMEDYKKSNIFKRILFTKKVDQIMSIYLEESHKLETILNELSKRYEEMNKKGEI